MPAVPDARAQQTPHIGYIYPAGGQQGTVLEMVVGGQYLNGVTDVYVSGEGVDATVIKHIRPFTRKQINDMAKKLRELRALQKRVQASKKASKAGLLMVKKTEEFKTLARKAGLEDPSPRGFAELRKKLADPKRQPNAQIAEIVVLRVTISPGAEPGQRELRLKNWGGVTNPLYLQVGQCREYNEKPRLVVHSPGVRWRWVFWYNFSGFQCHHSQHRSSGW